MSSETALLQVAAYIVLALVWPVLVLAALRTLGVPLEITPATYLAALVLVMSVKASKK